MFIFAGIAVLCAMAMALVRLVLGPTAYDRVLAVNLFGTKMVLLIAAMGFLTGRPDFLDIALAYAIINFMGCVAFMKFIRYWTRAENAGK